MTKLKNDAWLGALMTLMGSNWICLLGSSLSGVSAFLIIAFMLLGILHLTDSPYLGIMAFLILPIIFVMGLLIVPIGAWWEHRKELKTGKSKETLSPFPVVDFNLPRTRRIGALIVIFTAFNLFVISTTTYEGVVYMDSVPFCGQVCHTVMEPEYSAYRRSPHARVACVDCHIGPGASWFVRSKLSGLGQVLAVTLNTYPCPIPSPVKNLRPSRAICENCHWPEQFEGNRLVDRVTYGEDEKNTPTHSVLQLHIGGGKTDNGIHGWHITSGIQIRYTAIDRERQKISHVSVTKPDGSVTEYSAAKDAFTPEELSKGQERVMDCIDCHNRPTHISYMPGPAVDAALAANAIDPTIPYIKKEAVEVLTAAKGAPEDLDTIAKTLNKYYEENYADLYKNNKEIIDAAITRIQDIYRENVFPKMKVTWGTYFSNIGHDDRPGCYRCHGTLLSKEGNAITQDCDVCHDVLAWDEQQPKILEELKGK
jgi:hypothetical protein